MFANPVHEYNRHTWHVIVKPRMWKSYTYIVGASEPSERISLPRRRKRFQAPVDTVQKHAARRPSRPRHARPLRPRDWGVQSKLVAVLVIPALAFLALASVGTASSLTSARSLRRGGELARLGYQTTALVHELQLERDLVAGATARGRFADSVPLQAQQDTVDRAARAYLAAEAAAHRLSSARIGGQLDTAREELAGLADLRSSTRSGSLTRQAIAGEYSRSIRALLEVDLPGALRGGDEQLDLEQGADGPGVLAGDGLAGERARPGGRAQVRESGQLLAGGVELAADAGAAQAVRRCLGGEVGASGPVHGVLLCLERHAVGEAPAGGRAGHEVALELQLVYQGGGLVAEPRQLASPAQRPRAGQR